MKKLLLVLFVLVLGKVNAQSYELKIKMNDETEIAWKSETLRNIYFDDDASTMIVVENETNFTHSYNFYEINKIYFQSEVSLNEMKFEETSFVFPNPANDNIRIFGIENQEIEIFSTDGKLILRERYEGKSIDVSSLPQGLYLIKTNGQTLKFNKI